MRCLLAILCAASLQAESFEKWIGGFSLSPGDAAYDADVDGDRINNLLEYVLAGCDPLASDDGAKLPQMVGGELAWNQRAGISGVRLTVQSNSTDLLAWGDGTIPAESERGFLRLRVQHSPIFGAWSDEIDLRLAAATSTGKAIYVVQDHTVCVYERNENCWGRSIDLTPISPWNSDGGTLKAGILISPRHVLFAKHFTPATPCAIRFVTAENVMVERTLTQTSALMSDPNNPTDLSVGVLSEDVPETIGFATVLSANAANMAGYRVPVVIIDQEEKLLVADVSAMHSALFCQVPVEEARIDRNEAFISGDSGGPICAVADGRLAVLGCLTFDGAGSGTPVNRFITEINALITALGGGYQLSILSP